MRTKEQTKEYNQQYHQKNKEKINKRHIRYNAKHKEKISQCGKEYCDNNKEKVKQASRKWKYENKDRVYELNIKRSRNIKIIDRIDRIKLKSMYNNKCVYCGEELDNSFHIDHMLSVSRYEKIGKKCPHSYDNCVPSCGHCNETKKTKTPLEFIWNKVNWSGVI